MNLLGDGIHGVVAACVLIGLVGGAVALMFPIRLRWLAFARNVLVILLSSCLLAGAAGLELNRENAWYPTLDDLLGRTSTASVDTHQGARSTRITFGDGAINHTDERSLPALPAPGKLVQQFSIPTSVGRRAWPATVILPEGYFDAANAHRAYPVFVAVHGVPGSISSWLGSAMPIQSERAQLVSARRVAPFIIVIPEVTPSGMDTECILGPDADNQMETWLAKDLPAHLKGHLRAIDSNKAWAMGGYSAGGWCSAALPLLHPDVYGAGIVLGGYFKVWWGASKPSWAPLSAQAKRLDLVDLVHSARPRVALFVQTSKKDGTSWPTSREFLTKVKQPTYVAAQVRTAGGHQFSLWRPGLEAGLGWLGANVPGFKP